MRQGPIMAWAITKDFPKTVKLQDNCEHCRVPFDFFLFLELIDLY